MKKQVTCYECDICGNHGLSDDSDGIKRLPAGWAILKANTNKGQTINVEICTGCFIAVGNALGARKNEFKR